MRLSYLFLLIVFLPLPAFSDTKTADPTHKQQLVSAEAIQDNRRQEWENQTRWATISSDVLKDIEYIRGLKKGTITVEDVITKASLDQDSRALSTAKLVQALSYSDSDIRKIANSDLHKILNAKKVKMIDTGTLGGIQKEKLTDWDRIIPAFSFEVQVLLLNTAFWNSSFSARQGSVYAIDILKQLGKHELIKSPIQLVLLDIALTDISLAGGSKQLKATAILNSIETLNHQVQEMAVQALLDVDKESQTRQDRIKDIIEKIMTKTSLTNETESLLVDHLYHPNPTIRQTVHRILSSEKKLFFTTLEKLSQSLFKPESRFVEVLEQTASLLIKHLKAGYERGYHFGDPSGSSSDVIYRILLKKVQEPGTKKFRGRQVARIFLSLAQYLHGEAVQVQLAQLFRQNPDLMSALKLESIFGKMPPLHAGAKSELMAFINDPNTLNEYKKIAKRELKQNQRGRLSRALSKCARSFMP